MNEHEIAAALNLTVEELGEAVYALADWIDLGGNKGYVFTQLRDDPDEMLSIELLYNDKGALIETYAAAYNGILFYRRAKRKRERSGWMVRKTPHWTHSWADLYGWDTEQGQMALEADHQRALDDHVKWKAEQERKRLNRPERFELGKFSDYTDAQLKLLSEQLLILGRTFSSQASQQALDTIAQGEAANGSIWDMLEGMAHDGHSRIERELYLRHHPLPDFMYPEMPFSHYARGVSGDFKDTLTPDLWLLKSPSEEEQEP